MPDQGTKRGEAYARLTDAGGGRAFFATTNSEALADGIFHVGTHEAFEATAGVAIPIYYRDPTSATPTSLAPTAARVDVLEESSATIVQTFTVANPATPETFSFTPASAGTYRLRVQASRIDGLATDWRINSDNTSTLLAAGQSNDWGAGFIRSGTTIASFSYSALSAGGAAPSANRFVFPSSQFLRLTLAHQVLNQTRAATLAQRQSGVQRTTDNANVGTANPGVYDLTRTGGIGSASGVNNAFELANAQTRWRWSFANSALSGLPWTHLTAAPAGWTGTVGTFGAGFVQLDSNDLYTVDPRITFTQLLQLNDAVYGTPPSSKNVASGQRLVSDLAFLAARASNAEGGGNAMNGLAWTEKLWDSGQLISSEASPAKTRASVASTQGGETGWSDAFLVWDNALPGGGWNQKQVITSANATGLEVTNTRTLTLLAANPNFRAVVVAGPASLAAESDHWHAGDALIISFQIFDVSTRLQKTIDVSPVPIVILLRYHQTTQKGQYLNAAFVWVDSDSGPADEHALTISPADPKVYTLTIAAAATAGWGDVDLMGVVARANINSTPYTAVATREAVGPRNRHDKNAFDPTGLFK